MKGLPTASLVVAALCAVTPAHADTVWLFNTPTSPPPLGQSANYTGSDGTTVINAQAFGPNGSGLGMSGPVQLFGKGLGGDQGHFETLPRHCPTLFFGWRDQAGKNFEP